MWLFHKEETKVRKRILIQNFISKWNRTIATSFAIATFFVIVVILTIRKDYSENSRSVKKMYSWFNTCLFDNDCQFTCYGRSDATVPDLNELLASKAKDCPTIELTISASTMNNKLTKEWLKGVEIPISSLTLTNWKLDEFGTAAFTGEPFTKLTELTLDDVQLETIQTLLFTGTALKTLNISYKKHTNLNFEANVLLPMAGTLSILQIRQCLNEDNLYNITGNLGVQMTELKQLDIGHNNIKALRNGVFESTPFLTTLYITDSHLEVIEMGVFDKMSGLVELYIRSNSLKTLPEGVFSGLTSLQTFSFDGNPWNCNCDLVWLREYYIQLNTDQEFNCLVNGNFDDYANVDFCPYPPEIVVPCTSSLDYHNNLSSFSFTIDTISLRNQTVNLTFIEINEAPNYQLIVDGSGEEYLLWINSKDRVCAGCVKVHSGHGVYEIKNLTSGNTYTFCLLKPKEVTVNPLDCAGLAVPLPTTTSTSDISVLIGGIVGGLIVAILLTGSVTFFCVRQHPSWIKGNNRVILVGNRTTDALVMPRNFDRGDSPPSMISYNDGYLVPRMKSRNENRASASTHLASYSGDENFYEPPPQLPPNHPRF